MYLIDRHLPCFQIFILLQTVPNVYCLEEELPEPQVGTISPSPRSCPISFQSTHVLPPVMYGKADFPTSSPPLGTVRL